MTEDVAVSSVSICTASFTVIIANKLTFVYCLENHELKYRFLLAHILTKYFFHTNYFL